MLPVQDAAFVDWRIMSTTLIQPLSYQPRPRRCATHLYIAEWIHNHKKPIMRNAFWREAAASASTFDLNLMPSAELHDNNILGTNLDKKLAILASTKPVCRLFSLAEIKLATNNFDHGLVIGKGGFGKVYKGFMDNGASIVAIKQLNPMSKQGAQEFWTEIKMLSEFRHSNIVSLIGYCDNFHEMILVYEYMVHGTIADYLHKNSRNDNFPLSWVQRLKICIGAARELEYLHTGTGVQHRVIHRDVKSSNILLDEKWTAKISDFGISKIGPANQECTHVTTKVQGTSGYVDPEYFLTYRLTRKSDVYSFGVVLFEALCGRPALDLRLDEEQWSLAKWVQQCIREGRINQVIDPTVRGEIFLNSLTEFVQIAEQCLNARSEKRPTMAEVVARLELALALQERTDSAIIEEEIFNIGGAYDNQENTDSSTEQQEVNNVDYNRHQDEQFGEIKQLGDASDEQLRKNLAKRMSFTKKVLLFFTRTVVPLRSRPEDLRPISGYGNHLEVFSLQMLLKATKNFSEKHKINTGSFGSVYRATLGDGRQVAIMRAIPSASSYGGGNKHQKDKKNAFLKKVSFLSSIHHKNIVWLLGFCEDAYQVVVVYEYMSSGSLHDHLHERHSWPLMSWTARVKVAFNIARGIEYLHAYTVPPIIHGNIKSSNILLDDTWTAKVFNGLSVIGSQDDTLHLALTTDMIGCMDPEYYQLQKLTTKSDVYSFGVVLLELLTGYKARHWNKDAMSPRNVVNFAIPYIAQNDIQRILDHKVPHPTPFELEAVASVGYLAADCVAVKGKDRPTMSKIVDCLQRASDACLAQISAT